MTPKLSPCKDCPDRTVEPNCHMTCERYKKQVEEHEKSKEPESNKQARFYTNNAMYKSARRRDR